MQQTTPNGESRTGVSSYVESLQSRPPRRVAWTEGIGLQEVEACRKHHDIGRVGGVEGVSVCLEVGKVRAVILGLHEKALVEGIAKITG